MAKYWVSAVNAVWDATAGLKWSDTDGGAGGAAVPGIGDPVIFNGNSPANCAITTAGVSCASINCTGFTHTLSGNQPLACAGSLTWGGAGMTLTYNGAITLSGAGTNTITSNGKTTGSAVTINGAGGSWTLADAFLSTNTFTSTAGAFVTGGFTFQSSTFLSNGGTTRTNNFDNSTVTLTGVGGAINFANINLTFSNSGTTWRFTNASASARTLTTSTLIFNDILVTAGSGNLTFSGTCRNLDMTGYTGQLQASTRAVQGDLTFGTGMSVASTTGITSMTATSGTKVLRSNGVNIQCDINIDGVGGTFQLFDALTMPATRRLVVTNGIFDPNGKSITIGFFQSSNANARSVLGGVETWTLTGLASGTNEAWNTFNTTNLTFVSPTKIVCTDGSATTKIFQGGGLTFTEVRFGGTGTGIFQVGGANRFNKVGIDTPPHTLQFPHGLTTTIGDGGFDLTGTAANPNILGSTTAASTTTVLTRPGNDIVADFLSVGDLRFTGGARWFLGRRSTNLGNTNGARYTGVYRSP